MRIWLVATLLFCAAACEKSSVDETRAAPAVRPSAAVKTISIADLEQRLARGDCRAVDANGSATRARLGTIPGAILLSDEEMFALGELPADKSTGLAFYCANEYCGMSTEAAARAVAAGYTDVQVLAEGIAGWAKAGKQTTKL